MRILFLTQILPYPPDAGPRIKTWHVLNYLSGAGHEIILASFVRKEEEAYLPAVKNICAEVHAIPMQRSRPKDLVSWLRSQLTGRPFLIERDDLVGMRELVANLLGRGNVDAVHADQITMTQFVLPPQLSPRRAAEGLHSLSEVASQSAHPGKPKRVFDAHNATWTIVERMRHTLPWYLSLLNPVLSLEARRIKLYEGMVVGSFDHTLAVTDIDRQDLLIAYEAFQSTLLGNARSPSIEVIPIAVDTEKHQPVQRRAGSCNLLTLGSLNYPPNADGIRWFANEVFPLVSEKVPGVTLTIVGKNPPRDLIELAEKNRTSIEVTGYVQDLKPYLERSALVVVPVRAGSGMRVRILDMLALGMPVITTTVGLEGIDARNDDEVVIADTPTDMTDAIIDLLKDEPRQAQLARNGRRLAERRYDWRAALSGLKDIYLERIETHDETPS